MIQERISRLRLKDVLNSLKSGWNLKQGIPSNALAKVSYLVFGLADLTTKSDRERFVRPVIDMESLWIPDIPLVCHSPVYLFLPDQPTI